MDLASAFVPLSPEPVAVTAQALLYPGMLLPVQVPMAALPPALRARLLLAETGVPVADRVAAALQAGAEDDAWHLLKRIREPIDRDHALEIVLAHWAADQLARLRLPAARDVVVASADESAVPGVVRAAQAALADLSGTLEALPLPRWIGPVAIVVGDQAYDRLPAGSASLARAALPLVRLHVEAGRDPQEALAGALCALVLDLCAPPERGWPAWLRVGLVEVARARGRGDGPSPRAMLAARRAAGRDAIVALFTAPEPDPKLACAVCAWLCTPSRRAALGDLVDLLRNGSDAVDALRIAYGTGIEPMTETK